MNKFWGDDVAAAGREPVGDTVDGDVEAAFRHEAYLGVRMGMQRANCAFFEAEGHEHEFGAMGEDGTPVAGGHLGPVNRHSGSRVMTMCRRPGRMPGRLSKVLRPMIIALPMVSALNRFKSPGMCHGSLLSRPMTPLMARARTMVIFEAMARHAPMQGWRQARRWGKGNA